VKHYNGIVRGVLRLSGGVMRYFTDFLRCFSGVLRCSGLLINYYYISCYKL